MARDARKPVIPIGVEESDTHALLMANGEVRSAFNVTFADHDIGRIKAGYVCVRCYEAQDAPFPEHCWVCKFPMKERQLEFFGKAFQGDQYMGPATSLEDELAMLEEAQQELLRKEWGQIPSIIVPRSL